MHNLWDEVIFRNTAIAIISGLAILAVAVFPFRKKNANAKSAWASIQSWVIGAPIVLLFLGLGSPYPTIGLTLFTILGAKEFFQITGMYHRTWFVTVTYFFIIGMGASAHLEFREFYNILPMGFLSTISLIPIIRNSAKNMLQYIALSTVNFILIGWGFMNTIWIVNLTNGTYFLIYLVLLTEISDNISLAVTRLWGKRRIVGNITTRRTVEGLLASFILTLPIAFLLRPILPETSTNYWLGFSLVAIVMGSLGDLVLAVIRRDLGAKDVGAFIIGRGGILDRMDRLICTAPLYYYLIMFLRQYY